MGSNWAPLDQVVAIKVVKAQISNIYIINLHGPCREHGLWKSEWADLNPGSVFNHSRSSDNLFKCSEPQFSHIYNMRVMIPTSKSHCEDKKKIHTHIQKLAHEMQIITTAVL